MLMPGDANAPWFRSFQRCQLPLAGGAVALACAVSLVGCGKTPALDGKVVDIWGNPIEGATVMMVGQVERPLTDAEGRYHLTLLEGKHLVKAGREGYIQDASEIDVPVGAPHFDGPLFELYPKPKDYGFYLIGSGDYAKLESQQVVIVGNELRARKGIKSPGEAHGEGSKLRVLFHTELKLDEIMRLGLELHKLKFEPQAEMIGTLSSHETVDVNLYTTAGEQKIDIKPLRSRTDYLIVADAPTEPGYYAFQTQDLLNPVDFEKFNQIPEELRVVFPFEIR